MKRFLILLVAVVLLGFGGANALAGPPMSHHPAGVDGLRAAEAPPEGVYVKFYNSYYAANKYKTNSDSNKNYHMDMFAQAIRVIWNTGVEILGGEYTVSVIQPVLSVDHRMGGVFDDQSYNLSDTYLEPIVLAWHTPRLDTIVAFGVWVPTGWYSSRNNASPGFGYYTFMFTAGANLWLDAERTWHLSALSRYEINTQQEETRITPGQSYLVEWGLGKSITPTIDVGLTGYTAWQLTEDSGRGSSDLKSRAYAIGPEISFTIPSWDNLGISLRTQREFGVRNAPQGTMSTLSFTYRF